MGEAVGNIKAFFVVRSVYIHIIDILLRTGGHEIARITIPIEKVMILTLSGRRHDRIPVRGREINEYQWIINEYQWESMNVHEYQWTSMNINGSSMNINEHQWKPMNPSEHQWESMNLNGLSMNILSLIHI